MTYFDFWDFDNTFKPYSKTTTSKVFADYSLKNSPAYFNAAGFTSSDIKAEIKNGNILHISGSSEKYGAKMLELAVFVPNDVDQKSIELKVENGMIAVTFEHKREESKTIKVK